jgi:hypothetical protein
MSLPPKTPKKTPAQKKLAARQRMKALAEAREAALLAPVVIAPKKEASTDPTLMSRNTAQKKQYAKKKAAKEVEAKALQIQIDAAKADIDAAMSKKGPVCGYTQEFGDVVCARISIGESLAQISKGKGMPSLPTIYKWIRTFDQFKVQYDRAKLEAADTMVDQILDISDNGVYDELLVDGLPLLDENGKTVKVKTQVGIAHANLRVKARQWIAAKLKPQTYGDKIQTELTGANGGPIATINVEMTAKEAADIYNQNINRNK